MSRPEVVTERLISALTLSKKAKRLIIGFDSVKEAVLARAATLVLLSVDVSEKTKKEMTHLCREYSAASVMLPFKMDELWYLLGRKAGVMAVTDAAFAEKILTLLETV